MIDQDTIKNSKQRFTNELNAKRYKSGFMIEKVESVMKQVKPYNVQH